MTRGAGPVRPGRVLKPIRAFGSEDYVIPEPSEPGLNAYGRKVYQRVCDDLQSHLCLDDRVACLVEDYALHSQRVRELQVKARAAAAAGDPDTATKFWSAAGMAQKRLIEGLGRDLCQTLQTRVRLPKRPGAAARPLGAKLAVVQASGASPLASPLNRS